MGKKWLQHTYHWGLTSPPCQDFAKRITFICKLSLFGAQHKVAARVDSDVGLLAEFEPHHTFSLFELTRLQAEISGLIGKKVA